MALASGYRLGSIREHIGNVFSLGHLTSGFWRLLDYLSASTGTMKHTLWRVTCALGDAIKPG